MIGRVVARKYRIYDQVGTGAYTTVYLGRNLETNQVVAIKVLGKEVASDRQYAQRFRRAAVLAKRLQHRNIVRVLDQGTDNGMHFLVMEYVAGRDLGTILEREGRLSVGETVAYAEQICAGLQAAFELGLVHHDLKPANLLIASDGTVKIAEFGIAPVEAMEDLAQSGMFPGASRYMSPEMAQGAGGDVRSDLYSLGLIIYAMLTGAPPSDAEKPWPFPDQHLAAGSPPLRWGRPDVSPLLAAIVGKALANDPARRFQTPAEMLAALRSQAATPGTLPHLSPNVRSENAVATPDRHRRQEAPRGLVWGLIATAIVVAAGLVALLVVALQGEEVTLTPSATAIALLVPSDTASAQPTAMAQGIVATVAREDTDTPEPLLTALNPSSPTDTPFAEPTDTPMPTDSPSPEPTATPEPTALPSQGPTNTPWPADTSTSTPSPTLVPITGRLTFSAGGLLHIVDAATGRDTVVPIAFMRQPDFRADGQQIVVNGEGGGLDSLWTIEANTGAFLREQSRHTNDFRPFWSPDGTFIVYDSLHMGKGNYNLYRTALDSKGDDLLSVGNIAVMGSSPVWLHDDGIAFTACDYWVVGPRGGGSKCGIYRLPYWGGDRPALIKPGSLTLRATDNYGAQLVYMSQESGDWEVYLMPNRGGGSLNLSHSSTSEDGLGTFSPDGKLVAFVSNRSANWAIWVVKPDGGGLARLFDLPAPLTGIWTEEHISWGP